MASSSTSQPTTQAGSQAEPQTPQADRIDTEVPLAVAHPFDVWNHCLACHTTEHDGGHAWEDCPQPITWTGTDGENLDWVRSIPRNGQTASLIDLIRLLGCHESDDSDWLLNLNRRDKLYLKIHKALGDSEAPFDHQTWFRAMSAFNIFTDTFQRRRLAKPDVAARPPFLQRMHHGERVFTFLRRNTSSKRRLERLLELYDSFEVPMESTESALRKIKRDFDFIWEKWYGIVQNYLDTSKEMQNLEPADALWMRKAFIVMLKAQPRLDLHPLYVVSWTFPDLDKVIRDEKFKIPKVPQQQHGAN